MSKKVFWYQPEACEHHIAYPFTAEKPIRQTTLSELPGCRFVECQPVSMEQLLRAHSFDYLETLSKTRDMGRVQGMIHAYFSRYLQWYTAPYGESFKAAEYAAGAVCAGVNDILLKKTKRVFCAVRPPGHHAGWEKGEGFCFINNVAVGALEAISQEARVAIIDFDRHHGNGTEEIVASADNENLLFISSFQDGCGYASQPIPKGSRSTIQRFPLPLGSKGRGVLGIYSSHIMPLIEAHRPDIIMVSAGFDLHASDALRPSVKLKTYDYTDLTRQIVDSADRVGAGVISVLEGGYTIPSLIECVNAHVEVLGE